ncbi:neuronal acetylcholine receptor subunit alpha-10-like [Saccoglossus kowalevskii]|uniref:Neuronal acetylcholine receptor subunit alpha-9-like n=1 Tax=Saccoglossus kowalevskii TaxID=10224 RepID=A0ABM0GZ31_SACKO|nr:PREDICTED: neuronal acetylcholine receptor subunit alpha-9-like [Saccoglossus kowalevskii]
MQGMYVDNMSAVFVRIVGIALILTVPGIYNTASHYRLTKSVLKNYNSIVRPTHNISTVTTVTMQLFVSQIVEMDERIQTLKINSWLTLEWLDEYIKWNVNEYNGIDNVKLPSHSLWLPDIVLYENAANYYDNFMKDRIVVVYHTGDVMWAAPVIFQSQCQIDVTYFPFDKQECKLKFGPWQHDGTEVTITGKGDVTVFTSDGEWDMEYMASRSNIEFYPDAPGIPYTDVTYTIHLRRRPIFYFFNLITPCVLLAVVTLLMFFVPAEANEKITLGITVLLSLTVFLLLLADVMPPSSEVPLIGQYYAMTMVMVTMSLGMSVAVLHVHYKGTQQGSPVPQWTRKYILKYLASALRMELGEITSSDRDYLDIKCSCNSSDSHNVLDIKQLTSRRTKRNGTVKGGGSGHETRNRCNPKDEHVLFHLLLEFKKVVSYYDDRNHDNIIQKEWKHVAMVMDRLFMIVYIAGTLILVLFVVCQIGK